MAHSMPTAPPIEARVLGIAGMVGGAILLTLFVVDLPSGPTALFIAVFNFGALAIVIAMLRRGAMSGPIPALVGAALIAVSAWHAVMAMANIHRGVLFAPDLALWLTALFGAIMLRHPGITRWAAATLAIGCVVVVTGTDRLGLVSAMSPTLFDTLSQVGIVMVGVGWVVMGIDVAMRRTVGQPVL